MTEFLVAGSGHGGFATFPNSRWWVVDGGWCEVHLFGSGLIPSKCLVRTLLSFALSTSALVLEAAMIPV